MFYSRSFLHVLLFFFRIKSKIKRKVFLLNSDLPDYFSGGADDMYNIAVCDSDRSSSMSLILKVHTILKAKRIPHTATYYKNSEHVYQKLKENPTKHNLLFLETQLSPLDGISLGGYSVNADMRESLYILLPILPAYLTLSMLTAASFS